MAAVMLLSSRWRFLEAFHPKLTDLLGPFNLQIRLWSYIVFQDKAGSHPRLSGHLWSHISSVPLDSFKLNPHSLFVLEVIGDMLDNSVDCFDNISSHFIFP